MIWLASAASPVSLRVVADLPAGSGSDPAVGAGEAVRIMTGAPVPTDADTIVPFVRVQHLDVVRGPLDKMFGTATLVVHTAGTHNSIITLPGLDPERASEIRDIIRQHVRSDFG